MVYLYWMEVLLIVVFGGDGIYCVVVVYCGVMLFVVLFIGINNVFFEYCEVIVVGVVVGFVVIGVVLVEVVFVCNKWFVVCCVVGV